MTDPQIAELLDELTPSYEDRRGDWASIAAGARRRRRLGVGGSVVLAVAAALALALAWPFHSQQGGLFERALAAAGDGPVLHVVLRGEFGGTLLDLKTRERKPVHGDDEYWYDTDNGRLHTLERIGGVLQNEELSGPQKPPAELQALGRDYRRALKSGTAHIAGRGNVGGEPVAWLTITSQSLPDVADGKNHVFAQQVAVSERSFKPVALRAMRDGVQSPDTFQRVLGLEFVSASAADFTALPALSFNGAMVAMGRTPMPLAQARALLGRTPLWLGSEYAGLPLAAVYRDTNRIGHRHEVRVTGARAVAAEKCRALHGPAAARCFRTHNLHSIEVRPDGVFTTEGPITWSEEQTDVVLFYGTLGDDPATFKKDSAPQLDRPYVTVSESPRATPLRRGAGSYVPPVGSVFFAADGTGFLQVDGLQVAIQAAGEKEILAAAQALAPMPG